MWHFTGHIESALPRRHHLEGRDFRRPHSLPSRICAVHRGQATLSHLAPRGSCICSYQSRSGSGRKQDVSGWAVGTRKSLRLCTRRTPRWRTSGENLFELLFMGPSFQSAEPPQCPERFTFKKKVQILFRQFKANILRFG